MLARSLVIATAMLAAGACGDADPASEPVAPVITALETEDGADFPLVGVLSSDDGCLYVDAVSGVGLAVFPFGTTWDPSTSTAVHRSGTFVSVGDELSGTAERHPVDDLVPWFLSDDELARAQTCAEATGIDDAWVIGAFETGT